MSRKYFGTDGIRGRVGSEKMSPDFVLRLGRAAGKVLAAEKGGGPVVIGKDTRISGYMFESALEAGFSAAGVDTLLLGPMPTPGIAYLARTFRASAGVVISASHNPYYDNGIKFFSPHGSKLADDVEEAIEAELQQPFSTVESADLGKASRVADAAGRYIEFCKSTVPGRLSLKGVNMVLDCANGAAYQTAPHVFRELGANVTTLGVEPDGLNINRDVGSTSPAALRQAVIDSKADFGVALDGDADRVLLVDHNGELIDGDQLVYILACSRQQFGQLKGPVVGTLMSNFGLEKALAAKDIEFMRANVGDRYVMELLNRHGGIIGGESSGHIICLDRTTTGDGIVAALQVICAMLDSGKRIDELAADMPMSPQTLINVKCADKEVIHSNTAVADAVTQVEAQLGDRGRVLLRPSGTEPLIRVMVEGDNAAEVQTLAEQIADQVRAVA